MKLQLAKFAPKLHACCTCVVHRCKNRIFFYIKNIYNKTEVACEAVKHTITVCLKKHPGHF